MHLSLHQRQLQGYGRGGIKRDEVVRPMVAASANCGQDPQRHYTQCGSAVLVMFTACHPVAIFNHKMHTNYLVDRKIKQIELTWFRLLDHLVVLSRDAISPFCCNVGGNKRFWVVQTDYHVCGSVKRDHVGHCDQTLNLMDYLVGIFCHSSITCVRNIEYSLDACTN